MKIVETITDHFKARSLRWWVVLVAALVVFLGASVAILASTIGWVSVLFYIIQVALFGSAWVVGYALAHRKAKPTGGKYFYTGRGAWEGYSSSVSVAERDALKHQVYGAMD